MPTETVPRDGPDMSEKIVITLCMGSSCFARGNNRLLAGLEAMLQRNGWEEMVVLAGNRCRNRCGDGPNLAIDGVAHRGLDADAIEALLAGRLGRKTAGVLPEGRR